MNDQKKENRIRVSFEEFAGDVTIYGHLQALSDHLADHTLPGLTPGESEEFGSYLARLMKGYNDKYGADDVEIDEGEDIPLF